MAKPGASPPPWGGTRFTPPFRKDGLLQNRTLLYNETLLKEIPDRSIWFHTRLLKTGSIDTTRASRWEDANLPEELVNVISGCLRDNLAADEIIDTAQRQGVRVVNSTVNSYMTVFSVDAALNVKTSKAIIDEVSKQLFLLGNRQ